MLICEKYNEEFPNWIKVDGTMHNLSKRKYCTKCSPFGIHNTKKLVPKSYIYKCTKCGDTNEQNFYKGRNTICKKCKNKETYDLSREKRNYAIDYLGGKCSHCGYDEYRCALDIHHKNPNIKDKGFANMRHWSYERIIEEIKDCVLLCKNCHSALHHGELK